MIGTWRNDALIRPETTLREEPITLMTASIHRRRTIIAQSEPEDAQLTGMTRSLNRRLLALNLKPVASAQVVAPVLKVA